MADGTLREFAGDYKLDRTSGISVLTNEDISQLKSAGFTVEQLFDYVTENFGSLLHGSRSDIQDGCLRPFFGKIYSTNHSGIAIMKAIVSNEGLPSPGLEYPYIIDATHPLTLRINGRKDGTIGKSGFVYVINDKKGFINSPGGSWQYEQDNSEVPISAKVYVERSDFNYPMFDVILKKIEL